MASMCIFFSYDALAVYFILRKLLLEPFLSSIKSVQEYKRSEEAIEERKGQLAFLLKEPCKVISC